MRFGVFIVFGIILLLLLDLTISNTGPISISIRPGTDDHMDTVAGYTNTAHMELEPFLGGFEQQWRMGGADVQWEKSC